MGDKVKRRESFNWLRAKKMSIFLFKKPIVLKIINMIGERNGAIRHFSVVGIGVRAGGARGAAAPPVLKIFGQNAYDSGKSTWDKLFIESSFYNTTKWSILKRLNGSVCCRSLDAGICCSFAPNFLANSQKAVERVRFVKSLLFK